MPSRLAAPLRLARIPLAPPGGGAAVQFNRIYTPCGDEGLSFCQLFRNAARRIKSFTFKAD